MASVTSLTATRIMELVDSLDAGTATISDLNAVVAALNSKVEASQLDITEFHEITLPALQDQLANNATVVDDLNDNKLPDLQNALDENQTALDELNTVTLPSLQADLASGIENSLVRPQTYFSDVMPVEDELDEFYLNVDDVWYDTAHGNKQYRWDGTQWITFSVDIPDLSITVKKFQTSTHLIY